MKPFTLLGHYIELSRASRPESYWWHYDKSGNRCRHYLSVERVTARQDGLTALCVIVGPWRMQIG